MNVIFNAIKKSLEKRGYRVEPRGEINFNADFPTNYRVIKVINGEEKEVVVDRIGLVIGEQG